MQRALSRARAAAHFSPVAGPASAAAVALAASLPIAGQCAAAAFPAAAPRRGMRAVFSEGAIGIVDSVVGDSRVLVRAFAPAAPLALVVFARGAIGLVADMMTDGTIHVGLLAGKVQARETVALWAPAGHAPSTTAFLRMSGAWLGRVLDPLGRPLDGLGELRMPEATAAALGDPSVFMLEPCNQPLFAVPSPSITARAPPTSLLQTGYKVLDAMQPLVAGTTAAVLASDRTRATAFATELVCSIAAANLRAAVADDVGEPRPLDGRSGAAASDPQLAAPVHVIYCTVGTSAAGVASLVRELRVTGAAAHTTVIASPSDGAATPGLAYTAPFTAMALAERLAAAGTCVVVVVDSVPAVVEAGRGVFRCEGMSASTSTAGMLHALGQLMDRCAQLRGEGGGAGGSITGVFVAERPVESRRTATGAADAAARHAVGHVASLCDRTIELSDVSAAAGALLPLDFEALPAKTGHAVQGTVLRHYALRLHDMLAQIRETVSGVAKARAMGLPSEAETDSVMGLHAKTRLLLLPTSRTLARLGIAPTDSLGAATNLSTLLHLDAATASATAHSADGDDGSVGDVDAVEVGLDGLRYGDISAEAAAAMAPMFGALSRPTGRGAAGAANAAAARAAASSDGGSSGATNAFRRADRALRAIAAAWSPSLDSAASSAAVAPAPTADTPTAAVTPVQRVGLAAPAANTPLPGAQQLLASTVASTPLLRLGSVPPPPIAVVAALSEVAQACFMGPHRGDLRRTFLALFLVTHTYIADVPLRQVARFEAALYRRLINTRWHGGGEEGTRAAIEVCDGGGLAPDLLVAAMAAAPMHAPTFQQWRLARLAALGLPAPSVRVSGTAVAAEGDLLIGSLGGELGDVANYMRSVILRRARAAAAATARAHGATDGGLADGETDEVAGWSELVLHLDAARSGGSAAAPPVAEPVIPAPAPVAAPAAPPRVEASPPPSNGLWSSLWRAVAGDDRRKGSGSAAPVPPPAPPRPVVKEPAIVVAARDVAMHLRVEGDARQALAQLPAPLAVLHLEVARAVADWRRSGAL